MKSTKIKRNFWLTAEIECMLNLIKESKGTQNATSTSYTFNQIASKMKKRGFPNKSPTQIRRKWFQMKSAYLCYKKGNIDRLFLIPEKFRSVIAQFVENGSKVRRPALDSPCSKRTNTKTCSLPTPKPRPVLQKFIAKIQQNNSMINNEFKSFYNSLLKYEQHCQSVRDSNFMKYLDAHQILL